MATAWIIHPYLMEDHPTLQALVGWTSSEPIMNDDWVEGSHHTSETRILSGQLVIILLHILGTNAPKDHGFCKINLTSRRQEERTYIVISPLHDCPLAKCGATGQQLLMQEHVESGRQEKHFEMAKGLWEVRQAAAKARADQKKLESTKVADGTELGLSTKTGLDMEIVDDANFVKKCKPTHDARPGQGKQTRLNKEMDQTTDSAPALMPQHFRFVVETGLQ
ncbi:hypothetical protein CPB84DRAFT_1751452 [Gymnopilus junonius]|uniref:Uncharacterized protein n=1 Tax=Gymnopilus junonius TaxID=109634 RepID=A0A9P5TI44_GYMJU|nr:hypothetical protein CPB84DRAFT_1751452 [Gymnopilus junonius]